MSVESTDLAFMAAVRDAEEREMAELHEDTEAIEDAVRGCTEATSSLPDELDRTQDRCPRCGMSGLTMLRHELSTYHPHRPLRAR